MSGVVNRSVAEKAFAVKADELIRKPFQPQDLITRVKHLLNPAAAPPPPAPEAATAALSSIFGSAAQPQPPAAPRPAAPAAPVPPRASAVSPLAAAFAAPLPPPAQPPVSSVAPRPAAQPAAPPRAAAPSMDINKLKLEILRLENLVKKLQSELEAERQYSRALEEHVKTLQESE
jgi:DNA-binding response OmpR family regulator